MFIKTILHGSLKAELCILQDRERYTNMTMQKSKIYTKKIYNMHSIVIVPDFLKLIIEIKAGQEAIIG